MQKKIEIQLTATIDDGADILDRYAAFKASLTAVCGAADVVTRGVQYADQPDDTKVATFVTEVVVDRAFDFGEQFETVRDAVAEALAAQSVAILCANESDIAE